MLFWFFDICQGKLAEGTLFIKQMFLQLTSCLQCFYSLDRQGEDNLVEEHLSIGRLPGTAPDQGLEKDVSRRASSLCGVLLVRQQLPLCRGGTCPGSPWKPPTCTCCQILLQPVFTHVSMHFVPHGSLASALWSKWGSTRRGRFV